MIFLMRFGINKHLLIFLRPQIFVSLWKNLLVLIYSKLHPKSCDYSYKTKFAQNFVMYFTNPFTWSSFVEFSFDFDSYKGDTCCFSG